MYPPQPPAASPRTFLDPVTTLDGAPVPRIGMGTFGNDVYSASQVAGAVATGIDLGFRLIDCAAAYRNEAEIGRVLAAAMEAGVGRDRLFVVSKVWNDKHAPEDLVAAVHQSLRDLRVEALDACFIHWPFPNTHAPGAAPEARDPSARPYLHDDFMAAWRALETLVDEGLVRYPAVSNMTIPKLELLLGDADYQPRLIEMELHPHFQQGELFQYAVDHGMEVLGYSPLGSPARPARDRSPGDLVDMDAEPVRAIAADRDLTPAQVCLAWAVNRGHIPIPFSVRPDQLAQNLAAAQIRLTPQECHALRGLDRNNRLIKGQVFLWPGAASWLDLWDADGTIPGWQGYGS